jgi:CRP-like cAMP-binding protein
MELVSRMLDGSIPYDVKEALRSGSGELRVGQDEKMGHLEDVPLLEGCTRAQLREVARISRALQVPAGTVLTRAGEPGEEFFFIIDGRARVHVSAKKRRRLGPGEFFGEMSLLDGEPRSATVRAETDMRLLIILRRNFQTLLGEVPELTRSILIVLSRRLRELERTLNA